MSELDGTRTISIPSLAFNYVDGKLESIGHQGELYVRERTLRAVDAEMMRSQGAKSRWHKLFGAPERAARTLSKTFIACECEDAHCDACPLFNPIIDDCYYTRDYDALLEWLESESDG